jgi:hypothetical protein
LPQRYEKEIIQTNNLAKIEKIQRNKSPKIKKIQRNITYVPSINQNDFLDQSYAVIKKTIFAGKKVVHTPLKKVVR